MEIKRGAATAEQCARLWLAAGETVWRIRRVLLDADVPFMIEKAVLPASFFPRLDQHGDAAKGIALLARQFGVLLGKGSERIVTQPASAEVSEILAMTEGALVIALDRVILTLDGRPVEWRMGWCNLAGKYYQAQISG
jgi:GntR family transcriptional regulator